MEQDENPVAKFNRVVADMAASEAEEWAHMRVNSDEAIEIARESLREGHLSRCIATIALVVAILALVVAFITLLHSCQVI